MFGDYKLSLVFEAFGTSYPKAYALLLFVLDFGRFDCVVLQSLAILTHRRAWEACVEDDNCCQAMGINIRNMKLLASHWALWSGGIAGGLFASYQRFVSPESFTLMDPS